MATDIVLKDRNGQDVTYSGIETVTFDTPEEGVQTTFTHGELMEGVTIAANFANGDQAISVPDGYLVKEATIAKPAALVPENIRAGTEIAGVVGELIGDTEEVTVDLSMADGNQVIEPSADGKVLSKVTITKPETLIPENIAEGVDIGGVVGTFKGGGCDFDFSDENVQFFSYRLDIENKQIFLYSILYDALYEVNGSYDVNIPDKIGGYDVVIVCT